MGQDFRGNSALPLGLRNNNPLNIRPVSGGWQGQVGTDSGFATFDNIAWGIRAFVVNLNTSINNHGTTTLSAYLNRYAPPTENNTSSYIAKVASDTGINANAIMPQTDDFIYRLIRSQLNIESGAKYAGMVTDADISEGISLAHNGASSLFKAAIVYAKSNEKVIFISLAGGLMLTGLAAFMYFRLNNRK